MWSSLGLADELVKLPRTGRVHGEGYFCFKLLAYQEASMLRIDGKGEGYGYRSRG